MPTDIIKVFFGDRKTSESLPHLTEKTLVVPDSDTAEPVGEGYFGKIWALRTCSPELKEYYPGQVAVKCVHGASQAFAEASLTSKANNVNCVVVAETGARTEACRIYMPYYAGYHSLDACLASIDKDASLTVKAKIIKKLRLLLAVTGELRSLNRKGITHYDLQLENILVVEPSKGLFQVRVIDFGSTSARICAGKLSDRELHAQACHFIGCLLAEVDDEMVKAILSKCYRKKGIKVTTFGLALINKLAKLLGIEIFDQCPEVADFLSVSQLERLKEKLLASSAPTGAVSVSTGATTATDGSVAGTAASGGGDGPPALDDVDAAVAAGGYPDGAGSFFAVPSRASRVDADGPDNTEPACMTSMSPVVF